MTANGTPSEAEVLGYFDRLSNWGRWGSGDRLGTLNLITAEKRVRAARLVEEGICVPCAWDIDVGAQPEQTFGPPHRHFISTGQGLGDPARVLPNGTLPGDRQASAMEYLGYVYHGYAVTHLDGLSHMFWDGRMYNGIPAELVSASHGAVAHDITGVREGIVTRGVLVDAPRYRGHEFLGLGDSVRADELEEILQAQQVVVEPGDALLLRTGYGKRKQRHGPENVGELGRAGWHASCLPLFHELDVALIACDTAQDVMPSGYPGIRGPIHSVGLVAMGLYMVDNCNLELISAKCAESGRYTFQFVVAPIPFTGATGSPVNPLAIF